MPFYEEIGASTGDLYPEDETKDRFNLWESYLQQ
jgi:hypothetical protein